MQTSTTICDYLLSRNLKSSEWWCDDVAKLVVVFRSRFFLFHRQCWKDQVKSSWIAFGMVLSGRLHTAAMFHKMRKLDAMYSLKLTLARVGIKPSRIST